MKPEKALELVLRYGHNRRTIEALGRQIGEHLERCRGLDGKRLECDKYGLPLRQRDTDNKGRDTSSHLWHWYQPDVTADATMNPTLVWEQITANDHGAECPHCYAAHVAIQERKAARKALAAVKAAMTRCAA